MIANVYIKKRLDFYAFIYGMIAINCWEWKISSDIVEWGGCMPLKSIFQIPKTKSRFIHCRERFLKDAIPGCSWHWGISVGLWVTIKWNSAGTHTLLSGKHRIDIQTWSWPALQTIHREVKVDPFLALIGLHYKKMQSSFFHKVSWRELQLVTGFNRAVSCSMMLLSRSVSTSFLHGRPPWWCS